jgi:hypothetical protein
MTIDATVPEADPKRCERGNIEHVHLVISLIAGSFGISAAFAEGFGRPPIGQPDPAI